MATIQDVAKLANVSVSSVSNVLNGKTDRLRPDTFARVQEAIRKLGYRPNQAARQLKTGRIPIIGLLVPSTANPFMGQLASLTEAYAQKRYGYRILLSNTQRDKQLESVMFDDLIAFGVGAAIIISSMSDERHVESAIARGLAVVSYDRGVDPNARVPVDHVLPDNVQAGRLASQHLIDSGHTRLAFTMPAGRTISRSSKIEGFLDAAQAAGAGISAEVIEGRAVSKYGDSELAELGFEMGSKIARSRKPPTGLVAVNDTFALGLMAGIRSANKRVPEDFSVIGMDDFAISPFVYPALTSIAMPINEMAQAMVDRAVMRLENPDTPAEEQRFAPVLMVRDSVSPPAKKR